MAVYYIIVLEIPHANISGSNAMTRTINTNPWGVWLCDDYVCGSCGRR